MNMPHDPEDSGFCDFYVWTMFQQECMPYGTPDCHCLFDKLACCKVWFSAAVSLLATSIQLDWGLELAEIKIIKRPVCFKIVGPTSRQTSRIILRPDWGGPLLQLIKIIQDNPSLLWTVLRAPVPPCDAMIHGGDKPSSGLGTPIFGTPTDGQKTDKIRPAFWCFLVVGG